MTDDIPNYHCKPDSDRTTTAESEVDSASTCSPTVEFQGCTLHVKNGPLQNCWVFRVNGRDVLTAVSPSDVIDAISPENRKMIGQALAEYLANAQLSDRHE